MICSRMFSTTFRLVKVVENMREQIIAMGGEIRFQQRVCDFHIEDGHIRGLTIENLADGSTYELRADHVVLALGHSSRDTFAKLYERGVYMEAKPFSVGFRIEHPQGLIDRARLGQHAGHPLLGAADYKLVHHAANGRAVYSFCMCPGGTVVAATSEPHRVVTNGMSQYSRNERNANAGMVVGIDPRDYPQGAQAFETHLGQTYGVEALPAGQFHPLSGSVLQRQLESNAFELGAHLDVVACGQQLGDVALGVQNALALHLGGVGREHGGHVAARQRLRNRLGRNACPAQAREGDLDAALLRVACALVHSAAADVVAVCEQEAAEGHGELADLLDQLISLHPLLFADHIAQNTAQQADVINQGLVLVGSFHAGVSGMGGTAWRVEPAWPQAAPAPVTNLSPSPTPPIVIATRESRLALWQAEHVKALLEARGHS
eukprot:gene18170-25557_t